MPVPEPLELFASCISGTEQVLCDELRELGFQSVRLNRGGIPFRGTREEAWRACLQSRIAQRIQLLLARFPAPSEKAFYAGVRAVDWRPYLSYRQTLSVSAVTRSSALNHSGFVALKAKDAIVDQIRGLGSKRPSVDREDPDVRVFVYLAADRASIYLDLSGESLHKRGYRRQAGEAPLRETLAAAMLRLSGWDRATPLIDPLCGSGTIAIEAAQWAANRAPGLDRERFGFERWADFDEADAEAMRRIRGELRSAVSGTRPRIQAADADPAAIDAAKVNARAAGVRLAFRCRPLAELQGSDSRTVVVTNPPYGVRLEKDPLFCRQFATAVSRLHGWRVCLLAGDPAYDREIPAKPEAAIPLPNGDIPCRFLIYEMA